jgi:hypothetical protein
MHDRIRVNSTKFFLIRGTNSLAFVNGKRLLRP